MTTNTPPRGARVYVELDQELTKVLDDARKTVRLKRKDFIRWMLARNLLLTQSISALAVENAQ